MMMPEMRKVYDEYVKAMFPNDNNDVRNKNVIMMTTMRMILCLKVPKYMKCCPMILFYACP